MSLQLQRVIQHFNAEDHGGTWKANCPLCKHHTLSIDAGDKKPFVIRCWKCEDAGQAELARIAREAAGRDVPLVPVTSKPRTKTPWPEEELRKLLEAAEQSLANNREAVDFLTARGITPEIAKQLRLGSLFRYKAHRICVPYFDDDFGSSVYQLRYRALVVPKKDDGTPDKDAKWKCDKRENGGRRLFNLPLLMGWDPENLKPLAVTESELDAMMLASLGIAAVSVDSAKHKLTDDDLALLKQVKNLVLAFDQDEEGGKCTARFKELLPHARVLGGYEAKDLGDLRTAMGPAAFEQRLRKFMEQTEEANTTAEVVEPEPTKPELDLPDEALDGWLGQVCREHMADFPRAYAWLALMAVASIHVPITTRCRCNLYVALVGGAGFGKTSAIERAGRLLSTELESKEPGSGEGLAEILKGSEGAQRLIFADELGKLLAKSRIENSSLPFILNTLFNRDEVELVTKRDRQVINARASAIGGIVTEKYDEAFGSATVGGTHRRFLFGDQPPDAESHLWRDPLDFEPAWKPDPEFNTRPVTVRMAASVFEERDRWVKEGKIEPHLVEPVLRVAVIAASFDGREELTGDDLGPAYALLQYQARVRQWLKPNPGVTHDGVLFHRIMNYMRRAAPNGQLLKQRDVLHRTHAYDFGPTMVERTVEALLRQHQLARTKDGKAVFLSLSETEREGEE